MKTNIINENFYENYVENLLKARGIVDVESYLHPTKDFLQSPLDLKNIGQAGALYCRIIQKEIPKILIIVD